ncbi:ureidoglycolate lyase [Iningainema tapete]|uniref:Ureidoglycolate lyase n=1 Tax=Iningainema tapete BLCC-T55 TaxID=2748662 RepID=A0A8J6XGF2_9CYAN|nr:ureidoglycolate lyase [Iningainema tapete]MBD2775404.1 ureidoglycolate lyase [Iningainema tapete BLCC-T55]
MNTSKAIQQLRAEWISSENFRRFGQVIFPSKDGKPFDVEDAQLVLDKGIPRFYIMQLQRRGRKFHTITRHTQCTQCLGSLAGKDWLIAVCPPNQDVDKPAIEEIAAFRIPGNCFIKLAVGTWHAGPYFEHDVVDFYNLELSDTNVVDHFTHNFLKSHNLEFEIV